MVERKEMKGPLLNSAQVEIVRIQDRRLKAQHEAQRSARVADLARRIAKSGSWQHESVEGWEGQSEDLYGTEFLSTESGDYVALRPKIRNRALGSTYLELVLKPAEGEPETIAVIDGQSIGIPNIGKANSDEITAIHGLLDYIDAHDTK